MKLGENFGEREFQYRVFSAQDCSLEFMETGFGCREVDAAGAGVEQPNVVKSHGEMFVDSLAHFSEAVVRRKNFGEQEWRRRRKTDGYIRPGCGNAQWDSRYFSNLVCSAFPGATNESTQPAARSLRTLAIDSPRSCNRFAAKLFSRRRPSSMCSGPMCRCLSLSDSSAE